MNTYFICEGSTYRKVELSKEQIDIDMFGNEMHNGQYLYTTLEQVLWRCKR